MKTVIDVTDLGGDVVGFAEVVDDLSVLHDARVDVHTLHSEHE